MNTRMSSRGDPKRDRASQEQFNARVRRIGNSVHKRFSTPENALVVFHRTRLLRRHDINTPDVARCQSDDRTLVFDAINGRNGFDVLVHRGSAALMPMLSLLQELHGVTSEYSQHQYDPLRRIRPRLETLRCAKFAAYCEQLVIQLKRYPRTTPQVWLHGDFHARQLVFDVTDQPWILDLDDMASGDAEADLGNFAAHLTTSAPFWQSTLTKCLEDWVRDIAAAYRHNADPVDDQLTLLYGHLALVRRALKLQERGDRSLLTQIDKELLQG